MCPCEDQRGRVGVFWTPPATSNTRIRDHTAAMPMSERKRSPAEKREPFHIVHKVPSGDSPYVRAKHAQLISKDPNRSISLFWAAINAGDRVDSALKDMAVVMKQLNRSDEGIEAIKSFRHLCPLESQDSIDNLLLELYKRSGRVEEEAELLEHKLKTLEQSTSFGCRITRPKRTQGKQITMTIEQEKSRLLGNLGWVHLQLHNYGIAEQHYRKALSLEPDKNKECNLAICLMRMDRIPEAKSLLKDVKVGSESEDDRFTKSYDRAVEMLAEIELMKDRDDVTGVTSSGKFYAGCSFANRVRDKNQMCFPASVGEKSAGLNSAGLFTQPRGCKWDQRVKETRGAARRLSFEGKKLDQNMIHGLHEYIRDIKGSKKSWADIVDEEEQEELKSKSKLKSKAVAV